MPYVNSEKRKEYAKLWARKHRKKVPWRDRRKYTDKWRQNNREKYLAFKRRSYHLHKIEILKKTKIRKSKERRKVLEYYSNGKLECSCCHENTYEFLTLEHLNGGGGKHRKLLGPANVIRYLIKNNFPEGYGVLCYNCNCAKAFNKICPHQIDYLPF